ncbi:MAG: hypothetical protein GTN76_14205 [Candidatus Aenigmarchaeota archaeon]|nr:hypothetical protein [Candidatus Aenigmarchaeota archaeon]
MGKPLKEMRLEYMGLELLYSLSSHKIPYEDRRIFDEWSSYLNDVVSVNFYSYPTELIEKEFNEGTREMKDVLRKYGVNESEFMSELLQFLGVIFESMMEVMYERAGEDLKREIGRLGNEKIKTADSKKQKKLREKAKKEGIIL